MFLFVCLFLPVFKFLPAVKCSEVWGPGGGCYDYPGVVGPVEQRISVICHSGVPGEGGGHVVFLGGNTGIV